MDTMMQCSWMEGMNVLLNELRGETEEAVM